MSERRTAPFGCEAAVIQAIVFFQERSIVWIATASRSNGGKPPRHSESKIIAADEHLTLARGAGINRVLLICRTFPP